MNIYFLCGYVYSYAHVRNYSIDRHNKRTHVEIKVQFWLHSALVFTRHIDTRHYMRIKHLITLHTIHVNLSLT
mgnify:FL=1